jgi:hypothetical protein
MLASAELAGDVDVSSEASRSEAAPAADEATAIPIDELEGDAGELLSEETRGLLEAWGGGLASEPPGAGAEAAGRAREDWTKTLLFESRFEGVKQGCASALTLGGVRLTPGARQAGTLARRCGSTRVSTTSC